jgi:hypothetical protein
MAKFHQNDGSQFAAHGDAMPLDKTGNGSLGINIGSLTPSTPKVGGGSMKMQTPAQHLAVKKAASVSVAHREANAKRGPKAPKAPKLPGMLGG